MISNHNHIGTKVKFYAVAMRGVPHLRIVQHRGFGNEGRGTDELSGGLPEGVCHGVSAPQLVAIIPRAASSH